MEPKGTTVPWSVRVPQLPEESIEDWRKRQAVARTTQWQKDNPHQHKKNRQKIDGKRTYQDFHSMYWTTGRKLLLKKKYNITVEEYDRMFSDQNGLCAICGNPETELRNKVRGNVKWLSVDHNHATGKVRQLLCGKCNRAIGNLKESLANGRNLVAYLEKHQQEGMTLS